MFGSLLIGIVIATGFILLVVYTQKKDIVVKWWEWVLTVLAFLYAAFVLETIQAFLLEGTIQGAVVVGVVLSVIAIVWAVLLARFVFAPK